MLDALDVDIAVANKLSLAVQLRVELRILPLAIVVNCALFIDFGAESLDESNVGIDARLVVLVHAPLVFVKAAKILLQVHQLILQRLVVTLALTKFCSFLH